MGFVLEPWISVGPKVMAEDDREDDLGENELRVEGAVWNEAAEEG